MAGQELWDVQSRYMYMEDLLELNRRVPSDVVTLPEGVNMIATPLCWEAWARELQSHPDREFAEYIVGGIQHVSVSVLIIRPTDVQVPPAI